MNLSGLPTRCELPEDHIPEHSIELKDLGNSSLSQLEDISFDDTSCLEINNNYDRKDLHLTFKDLNFENTEQEFNKGAATSYLESAQVGIEDKF